MISQISLMYWVFQLLCLTFVTAVLVETTFINGDGSQISSDSTTYYHITGDFGPQSFDVNAPLTLSTPQEFCDDFDLTNCEGKIVLIKRGGCSFVHKVFAAQQRGALGVIVGNNDASSQYQYVIMGVEDGFDQSQIRIPSVFVEYDTYEALSRTLELAKPSETTLNVSAVLDNEHGEVRLDDFNWAMGKTTGYLMLVLPVVWCVFIFVYVLKRWIIRRRDARLRSRRNMRIPLVPYENVAPRAVPNDIPCEDIAAAKTRIHNEVCAICLDDFKEGDSVKVLPCSHGFHGPCIDPWINERSDLCPICKASIFDAPDQKQPLSSVAASAPASPDAPDPDDSDAPDADSAPLLQPSADSQALPEAPNVV